MTFKPRQMSGETMRLVKPDYDRLLVETHRRWIETRDAKDGDRFADVVLAAARTQPEKR